MCCKSLVIQSIFIGYVSWMKSQILFLVMGLIARYILLEIISALLLRVFHMCRLLRIFTTAVLLFFASITLAEDVNREQIKGLDEQVQDIKKNVLDLTSELSRLEEKLLFPSNTQVSLFVSLNKEDEFRLDSIQIKLNNKVVAHHLYSYRELEALYKGGVQRIYTGNIKTGDHDLVVSFIGKASAGGDYQRSASYKVNKAVGPKFVEIQIADPDSDNQDIRFKDW